MDFEVQKLGKDWSGSHTIKLKYFVLGWGKILIPQPEKWSLFFGAGILISLFFLPFQLLDRPTSPFTNLELYNPSHDVPELHRICPSTDFEAILSGKGSLGGHWTTSSDASELRKQIWAQTYCSPDRTFHNFRGSRLGDRWKLCAHSWLRNVVRRILKLLSCEKIGRGILLLQNCRKGQSGCSVRLIYCFQPILLNPPYKVYSINIYALLLSLLLLLCAPLRLYSSEQSLGYIV